MAKKVVKPEIVWASFQLTKQLRKAVKNKSRETGVSASFVVRKALQSWVDEKKGSQS